MNQASLRDNLIATIGRRAGYMEGIGLIEIDGTVRGEDLFAEFAVEMANAWLSMDPETMGNLSYDEYIETELLKKYGMDK